MGHNFHETAHNKIDPDKFAEGIERVYGKKEEIWCECGYKPHFCQCNLDEKEEKQE